MNAMAVPIGDWENDPDKCYGGTLFPQFSVMEIQDKKHDLLKIERLHLESTRNMQEFNDKKVCNKNDEFDYAVQSFRDKSTQITTFYTTETQQTRSGESLEYVTIDITA